MTPSQNKHLWALLVGINRYPHYNHLAGCENDVLAIHGFLDNHMNVPGDHIRCLIDDAATRANLLHTFQDFLINNPAIQFGDQILCHFSGHGALMRDPTNPTTFCESLVAYDSGQPGIFNIPDKILAALLAQLAAQKGKNITVILDCCHAGSATRFLANRTAPRVRFAEDDRRIPPADLDARLRRGFTPAQRSAKGWAMSDIEYTLLAACRNNELAMEYCAAQEVGAVTHGALTYFLLQTLQHSWAGLRYDELMERVAAKVNAYNPRQMPQCEGNRGRAVFDGAWIEREPLLTVQSINERIVTLNAGLLHGLRQGVEVAIYPATVRQVGALPPTPLATALVQSVTAVSAQAEIEQLGVAPATLEQGRALITKRVYESYQQTVGFHADDQAESTAMLQQLRKAIQADGPTGNPALNLAVVDSPAGAADLIVAVQDQHWIIYANESTTPLVEPEKVTHEQDVQKIVYSLESIARYRRVVHLTNDDSNSRLQGKVSLGLRKYTVGREPAAMQVMPTDDGREITLEYDPDQTHSWYLVEVVNRAELPIYPYLFILQPDYSIYQLYPRYGQEEILNAGQTLYVGQHTALERLNVYLPGDAPGEKNWSFARDCLKLIVTTEPCSLEILQQGGLTVPPPSATHASPLRSPLDALIDATVLRSNFRFHQPCHNPGADWGTTELAFGVVRK